VLVGGIIVLVVGLLGLGAGAAYGNMAGEAAGVIISAVGVISTVAGAGLKYKQV
jgi:hypothetical protein